MLSAVNRRVVAAGLYHRLAECQTSPASLSQVVIACRCMAHTRRHHSFNGAIVAVAIAIL